MSYIAFDLDALNRAPAAARAAGVPEESIIAGLVRMWAWCFREKVDRIDADQVRGHFGSDTTRALVAFGFLETSGDGWRVRGAERYLRISEARSRGGKAASGNLKRGNAKPKVSRRLSSGSVPAQAGEQSGGSSGLLPGLTPSTEHRAPNTKNTAPAAPTPVRDSDLLVSDFKAVMGSDYRWQGAKDGAALASLLKTASIDEIRARWRRGLSAEASAWASCRTVAQLASKWNDLADAKPVQPPKPYLRDLG